MTLPFAGMRVLDLTTVLSGPFCTYQLALLGAEVVKIEQPGSGDQARTLGADPALNAVQMGAMFLAQSAGKQSLTLNLKHPRARQVFRRLAAGADVLVENFRPGVMERLGLGYAQLRPEAPRLIYCAISGFGQDSPYRDNPAYDQIVQGLSGAMSTTGEPGGDPLRAGYPVGDTAGGMAAAFAIACALLQRERSGQGSSGGGQYIDVSLLDSLLGLMGWVSSNYLVAGQEPERVGNDNAIVSPSGSFRARDGLLNIAANAQGQFEALARTLGRPEWLSDPRFRDRQTRLQHRTALKEEIEAVLATQDAATWEERLNRAGVPAGRVLALGAALRHPHMAQRGLLRHVSGAPGVGRDFDVLTACFKLSGTPLAETPPPPRLGEHTEPILRALGLDAAEIAALRQEGAI